MVDILHIHICIECEEEKLCKDSLCINFGVLSTTMCDGCWDAKIDNENDDYVFPW